MDEKTQLVQHDFDRLAPYEGGEWNHNNHYSAFLLKHMPTPCGSACEVGCGIGELARKMAARAESVMALDLSPAMIAEARAQSDGYRNIHYVTADVMGYEFAPSAFDYIVSVATLHHMDALSIFAKLRNALAPGGMLAVLDLYKAETLTDYFTSVAAIPINIVLRLYHQGHVRQPANARELWAEHGKHDSYLALAQVRNISANLTPGAVVRRHLLWRYSLLWKKPAS